MEIDQQMLQDGIETIICTGCDPDNSTEKFKASTVHQNYTINS